jgi:hypothetical protein
MNTKQLLSRRNFLKSGSLLTIGSALAKDPGLKFLTTVLSVEKLTAESFTCELFRASDMLQLKFYFINAQRNKSTGFVTAKGGEPLFMYCQIPPQHIGEQLIDKFISRAAAEQETSRVKSFLSGHSWLAFKLLESKNAGFYLTPESLMDWEENFELITLDSFAKTLVQESAGERSEGDYGFTDYVLEDIKQQHKKFSLKQDALFYNKSKVGKENGWPLTTFEAPYKLLLSPIAPAGPYAERMFGTHVFKSKNELLTLLPLFFKEDKKPVQIYSPWKNELIFKTYNNIELKPRFKAVHYDCQDEFDSGIELLPSPLHRFELRGLTMKAEGDRDVLTEMFHISATGATANLRYKNDDPTKDYAIVAWEQRMIEARDKYVSITYRAIDVFTGIKLHVSVLTERDYREGLSFLPKLFYVSFAEKEKDFQDPITISKLPFVKIIPKTIGAYFQINEITQGTAKGYVVAKSELTVGPNINCGELIAFDYLGIDKDRNEHNFKSKMIFIPAESYQITSGSYQYSLNGIDAKPYKPEDGAISLAHIGKLNPSNRDDVDPALQPDCEVLADVGKYTFKIVKTFDDKELVKNLLDTIKAHVSDPTNLSCYEQSVIGEVAYARLEALKTGMNVNPLETSSRAIRSDSKAASFVTDKLLLFADLGEFEDDGKDNYLQKFPLVPKLVHSYVVISQINQIEGRQVYRRVEFAEDYIENKFEIDEPNPKNKVKLLLKLLDRPENFFSRNFKSSGAVVNPGIDIQYVSVLDEGIIYNRSHNRQPANPAAKSIAVSGNFSSATIFQNLDAKILGIPLLAVLEDVLPVEDLPAFSYLKDAQNTANQISSLVEGYKDELQGYKDVYEQNLNRIKDLKAQLEGFDLKIKLLKKNPLKIWLEELMGVLKLKNLYQAQLVSFSTLAANQKSYYQNYYFNVLAGIKDKSDQALDKIDIKTVVDSLLSGRLDITQLNTLYDTVLNLKLKDGMASRTEFARFLKESVKIYVIEKLQDPATEANLNLQEAILIAGHFSSKLDEKVLFYHNAVIEALQEAVLFSRKYVGALATELEKTYHAKKAVIGEQLRILLKEAKLDKILEYIFIYEQLIGTYEQYRQLSNQFKLEYYKDLWENSFKLKAEDFSVADFKAIEGELIKELKANVSMLNLPASAPEALKSLKAQYLAVTGVNDIISFGKAIEGSLRAAVEEFGRIVKDVDSGYDNLMKEISDARKELCTLEDKVKDYARDIFEDISRKLKEKEQQLLSQLKGSSAYKTTLTAIEGFQQMIRKLKEFSKQSLDYQYKTKKFRQASLGVIEFLPTSGTQLEVKVNYQLEFELKADLAPMLSKQSYLTDSALTDFKIGLMQFLYIDFERVRFKTGSDVKDDFTVRIRDVQFAGMLSFVQAFQQYLKSINDNLVFDISSSGVSVGYGFAIPDFPAGYFNFFNLSFTGLLTLPFDPKKSLQLKFGIGSELSKFGITVCGIFGGQGYFNITAETGRGVVGMELVLEFGAIFNLNLGFVANGTAYLVGGIYIRKYYDSFHLKGYILAVGRFSIIGLFSANLSFYLGLEYDGEVLKGVCQVTASKRFTRFFEISVSVQMEKTISGAKKEEKSTSREKIARHLKDAQVLIEDTNLSAALLPDQQAYLVLSVPADYSAITVELSSQSDDKPLNKTVQSSVFTEKPESNIVHINLDAALMKDEGGYLLVVKNGGKVIYEGDFSVVAPLAFENSITDFSQSDVDAKNYYESYF